MVKSDKKLTKIFLEEVEYVETFDNYIIIYRDNGDRVMSDQTLTQFEEQLRAHKFIRIHRHYLLSLKAVK